MQRQRIKSTRHDQFPTRVSFGTWTLFFLTLSIACEPTQTQSESLPSASPCALPNGQSPEKCEGTSMAYQHFAVDDHTTNSISNSKRLGKVKLSRDFHDHNDNIKRAKKHCEQALINLSNEDTFYVNIGRVSFPEIELTPNLPTYVFGKTELYPDGSCKIFLLYNVHYTVTDYEVILRNELFTYYIIVNNRRAGVHAGKVGLPFLKQDGTVDHTQFEIFYKALTTGMLAVEQYDKLLSKQTLSEQEKSHLDQLLNIVSKYKPKSYYLPLEFYTEKVKSGEISEGQTTFHVNANYGMTGFGKKIGQNVFYTFRKDKTLQSKATALIKDILNNLYRVSDKNSPYAAQSREDRFTELGSFIAELPTNIQKFIFPDFYDYMHTFFLRPFVSAPKHDVSPPKHPQTPHFFQETAKTHSKQKHETTRRPHGSRHHKLGAR